MHTLPSTNKAVGKTSQQLPKNKTPHKGQRISPKLCNVTGEDHPPMKAVKMPVFCTWRKVHLVTVILSFLQK
jgi:hypothetical protein